MASLEMELDSAEENLSDEILNMSTADIQARTRLLDNEIRIMRSELGRLQHELPHQGVRLGDRFDGKALSDVGLVPGEQRLSEAEAGHG